MKVVTEFGATVTATETTARIILMMGISLDGFVAVHSDTGLSPVMEGGEIPPEDPELTKAKLDRFSCRPFD